MRRSISGSVALLVPSCDRYSDLWRPFFELLRRFWPRCPLKTYLLSNTVGSNLPDVTDLLVGRDPSWSDSLGKALERLEEEYVFLFLEDLFLCRPVMEQSVLDVLGWAVQSGANYVRFNPSPKPDRSHHPLVGSISRGAIYRTSTVLSLWKKKVLFELLVPGESAWEFEVLGSFRSDRREGFYCTRQRYFPIINGVIKGKWLGRAVRRLEGLGVQVDLTKRPVMTVGDTARLYFQEMRSSVLRLFPARYQRQIKHVVLRGNYRYGPSEGATPSGMQRAAPRPTWVKAIDRVHR